MPHITLNGTNYQVTPAPLGRIPDLMDAVNVIAVPETSLVTRIGIYAAIEILEIGIGFSYPDMVGKVRDIPASLAEVSNAVKIVLEASGLRTGEVSAPEAAPAPESQSITVN